LLGVQGAQGLLGLQGNQGLQGPNAAIAFSTNPPSSPLLGDRWTDSNSGSQYTWVTDGVNYYWIELSASGYSGVQGIQGIQGVQGVQGTVGSQGAQGVQGVQGVQGLQGSAPNLLAVGTDILPAADNTSTLGNATYRWKSVFIGPGTINITDQTLGTTAGLTVNNGVLQVNGANQLQVGQLKFVDNTIESTTGAIDIQIGIITSSASLVLNRNTALASGKSLTFGDATVQTTAYVPPANTSYASTWAGTGLVFTGTPTTAIYSRAGKIIQFQIAVVCTNVSNFGTGAYTLTLPVASDGPSSLTGTLNIGGTIYPIVGTTTAGSSTVTLYGQSAGGGGSKLVLDPLTKNSLGNFATSTVFNLAGSYLAQ
jgi:hypothetical protein